MKFKKGDRVIKARPYRKDKYCYHGGDIDECPIGTKGVIVNVVDNNRIVVEFTTACWTVSGIELDLIEKKIIKYEDLVL